MTACRKYTVRVLWEASANSYARDIATVTSTYVRDDLKSLKEKIAEDIIGFDANVGDDIIILDHDNMMKYHYVVTSVLAPRPDDCLAFVGSVSARHTPVYGPIVPSVDTSMDDILSGYL